MKKLGFFLSLIIMAWLLGSYSFALAQNEARWERISNSSLGAPRYYLAEKMEPEFSRGPGEVGGGDLREPLLLSLQDCINMALRNNLDIAVEGYNPRMSQEDIRKEKAAFDPLFFTGASYSEYRLPTNNAFYLSYAPGLTIFPDERETRDLEFGLKQRLVTGTSYELRYDNERWYSLLDRRYAGTFYAFNPSYTSVLSLTLSQPLLRNFGIDINKTKINIARNNKDISLHQFRSRVFGVVSDVQSFYWELIGALENLEVNRRSLKLAQNLLEISKAKVKAGTLAPLEIVAAEAEVAAREEGVIVAENLIKSVEDKLRRAMNLPQDSQMWERPLKPADKPTFIAQPVSVDESLKKAWELRPDLLQAKIDLTNKDIYRKFTRNQLFPSLNLQGSAGLNGIGDTYHDDFRVLRAGDYYSYSVGLVLEVPLGNRAARAEYSKASLDQEKSKTNLSNLEQKITIEIREAIRQIQTNLKRIEATKKARILAEKKLEVEQKKLDVGMSTSFEVLQYQKDLVEAETNEVRALIEYNKSVVNLERAEGSILEKHDIQLNES